MRRSTVITPCAIGINHTERPARAEKPASEPCNPSRHDFAVHPPTTRTLNIVLLSALEQIEPLREHVRPPNK
jgi:hypothetical protein